MLKFLSFLRFRHNSIAVIIAESALMCKSFLRQITLFPKAADSTMKLDSPDGTLAAALSGLILCSAICAEREALYERIQLQGK